MTQNKTTGTKDATRTAAAKTATVARKTARAAKTATPDDTAVPFTLTRDDVIATFANVRRDDAGNVINDNVCGAPMISKDDGIVSGEDMARALNVNGKTFRGWLRAKGLPRQAANADDAARIMRAYQSRGARPSLSTDVAPKDATS